MEKSNFFFIIVSLCYTLINCIYGTKVVYYLYPFNNNIGFFYDKKSLFPCKTSHRITKEEKSGKIVANQGIWMETAE